MCGKISRNDDGARHEFQDRICSLYAAKIRPFIASLIAYGAKSPTHRKRHPRPAAARAAPSPGQVDFNRAFVNEHRTFGFGLYSGDEILEPLVTLFPDLRSTAPGSDQRFPLTHPSLRKNYPIKSRWTHTPVASQKSAYQFRRGNIAILRNDLGQEGAMSIKLSLAFRPTLTSGFRHAEPQIPDTRLLQATASGVEPPRARLSFSQSISETVPETLPAKILA